MSHLGRQQASSSSSSPVAADWQCLHLLVKLLPAIACRLGLLLVQYAAAVVPVAWQEEPQQVLTHKHLYHQ
jgi:hypothetical protein